MKSKTKTAKKRTPKAPPMVRILVESLLQPSDGIVDAAYARATNILVCNRRPSENSTAIAAWVEQFSDAYMRKANPKLLEADIWGEGGTIQVAFQDPSFALGFCMAYQMLMKEGAR